MPRARVSAWACLALGACWPTCSGEWVLVNLIRHGERYDDKSNHHLRPLGYERAEYIAKCVMSPVRTLAFPLGAPEQLLASFGHNSLRPKETLEPLAREAGIKIDNHIEFTDVEEFRKYVAGLRHGQTLFVAWQHKWVATLAESLDPGGLAPRKYPEVCDYAEWDEPDRVQGGYCYDVIWQLALYRHNSSSPWRAQAFSQMHMGFAGSRHDNCTQAFRPHSNPDHWNHHFQGPEPFDCSAGLANWKLGWSVAKVAWCCKHQGVACESDGVELAGVVPAAPGASLSALVAAWILGAACAWPCWAAASRVLGRRAATGSSEPLLK